MNSRYCVPGTLIHISHFAGYARAVLVLHYGEEAHGDDEDGEGNMRSLPHYHRVYSHDRHQRISGVVG